MNKPHPNLPFMDSNRTERIEGVLTSLRSVGVISERDLGSFGTRSGSSEQVSLFYGEGRKVVCGLGFRDGRLTCSLLGRNTEQQQPTQKPNNVSPTRI